MASFGTYAITAEISIPLGHPRSLAGMETKRLLLGVAIAALLGFFVNRYRPTRMAVWVWILPVWAPTVRNLYSTTRTTSVFGNSIPQHFLAPNCLDDTA